MTNRYFNPTPYEGKLYAPPVEFISGALEKLQGQFDTNFEAANELRNTYLDALPQDRAAADQFQNNILTQIDAITNKYSGDYSQATRDLQNLQQNIRTQLRPGTEFHTIASNYKIYNEAVKRERDRLVKGDITQRQYSALLSDFEKNYKGVKMDPVSKTYNPTSIETLESYSDATKIANEVLDKLKPRERKVAEWVKDPKSGMLVKTERTISSIDPNEASVAVQNALLNDQKFMSYFAQVNRLQGMDTSANLSELLTEFATELVPAKTGVFKDLQDQDLREDPVARDARNFRRAVQLEELRYQNRIRFEDFKNQQNINADGGDVEILGLVKQPKNYSKLETESRTLFTPTRQLVTVGPESVDKLLKERTKAGVNYELLESLRKANPTKSSRDIAQMYNDNVGKDNSSTELYYTRYQTTVAQKEEAERIVPQLRTGNVPIFEYDPTTQQVVELDADSRSEVVDKMFADSQDKTKVTARALGKSSTSSGDMPFGTIISPAGSNKTYIVADMSTKMNDFNFGRTGQRVDSRAYKLFGWQKEGNQGPAFEKTYEMPDGSKRSYTIMGVRRYEYDETLKQAIPHTFYVRAVAGPNGHSYVPNMEDPLTMVDPTTGQKRLVTPFDLEREEITPDLLYSRMPHRARSGSSSSNIPMETF